MNEKKVGKYLKNKGIVFNWTIKDVKKCMNEMYSNGTFGWETGGLCFKKTKKGRKYIEFIRTRCYLD